MSYLFENNKDHQFSQNLKILALQATRILNWYQPTPDWSGAKRSGIFPEWSRVFPAEPRKAGLTEENQVRPKIPNP